MTRRLVCFLLAILCALGLSAPGRALADTRATVDFARAHPFAGLGLEIDLGNRHPEAAQRLLHDLHARFVRVAVLPNLQGEVPTGLSVERYRELMPQFVPPRLLHRIAALKALLHSQQLGAHLVFWHMPESWEAPAVRPGHAARRLHHAVDARVPDYARLLTAELMWVVDQGIDPYAVELTNEPQGGWDTRYTPAQYAQLVATARAEFDRHGLRQVRIEGPGTALRNAPAFLQALRAAGALGSLSFLTAHVYDPPQHLAALRQAGADELLAPGPAAPVVITEFGVKQHRAQDAAATTDLDVSSPDYGLRAGAVALELLGQGATSILYWQLADVPDSPKRHGALDLEGHRRPVARALQALFGELPAPSSTAPGTGGAADLPIEGFSADGRVWLLMANLADAPQRVSVHLDGVAVHGVSDTQGYVDGALNAHALSQPSLEGAEFTGTLAAHALAAVALR